MPLSTQLQILTQADSLAVDEDPLPHWLYRLLTQPKLQFTDLPTLGPDVIPLSKHYSQIAHILRPFIPHSCWLGPEDVKPIGNHPMAAGGVANIWAAIHDGHKVVLKSYRCYMRFNVAQATRVRFSCNIPRKLQC